MIQNSLKHQALVLLLVLFCFKSNGQAAWDLNLLAKINGGPEKSDRFWEAYTNSITYVTVGTPMFLGTVGVLKKDEFLKRQFVGMAGGLALNGFITVAMKYGIARPRPFVSHGDLIYKKTHAGSSSFPSGHTSSAFQWATSCVLVKPNWYVVVPAYMYACGIAYSRMHLGVHYPTDILSGAVVGTASAFASYYINNWFWKKMDSRKKQSSLLITPSF
jgi:membrane-associated phospholipid phosphatase